MNQISVLDHGYIRLVDHMGSDLSVVRAARVSYDAAWRAGEDQASDTKLINYLWSHRHTTPFESVTFTFEVKAPIFVLRQWMRHRMWSYSEISARYTALPNEFYLPDFRLQSTKNKQGSSGPVDDDLNQTCRNAVQIAANKAFDTYQNLLDAGIARELARCVLPVSTYSTMFATVNLLNLLKFLTLRCDEHAQYEIRVYAEAMRELIRPIVPVCVAAWEKTK